jgi:hypothetical protein
MLSQINDSEFITNDFLGAAYEKYHASWGKNVKNSPIKKEKMKNISDLKKKLKNLRKNK